MTLSERYRPATFDDVVSQDKAIRVPKQVLKDCADPKAAPPPEIKRHLIQGEQ